MAGPKPGAMRPLLTPLDVLDVLYPAVESLTGDAERVHIEPPVADTPQILADGPLLERVVANLLTNAIQHTDTAVYVRAESDERGGVVRILVSDNGPGI